MSDYDVIQAMIRFGGSFIKSLATTWQYADDDNQRRLKEAFPEYWVKYTEIANRTSSNNITDPRD